MTPPAARVNTPRRSGAGWVADAGLVVPILAAALPVLWLLYSSFRLTRYIISPNPTGSALALTLSNYSQAFSGSTELSRELVNSIVIVVGTIVIAVGVGGLAGYSLSKLDWSRKTIAAVLGTSFLIQLLPPVTLLPGFYLTLQRLGVLGSVGGLVLLNAVVNVPFATILMKVYFDAVPGQLREAATIDGASELKVMRKVMLPLAAPGLATTSILVGIFAWNEFLMGLTLSSSTANAPFTVGMANLLEPYTIQFGPMAAAASVAAIPMIAISVIGGRYLVSGLTAGALK